MKTRIEIMDDIHKALLDGHPNPEGFIEWCNSLSDEEFMREFDVNQSLTEEPFGFVTGFRRLYRGDHPPIDQGELDCKIAADHEHKVVRISFAYPINWLGFEVEAAAAFCEKIMEKVHEITTKEEEGGG